MLLTNIGDLNMRKRILFGSMLVIICMLLLSSTSTLQIDDEFEDKINLEYIKDIQSLDYDQLAEFFIDLSEDYPLIQKEIIDQIEEIDNQLLEKDKQIADMNAEMREMKTKILELSTEDNKKIREKRVYHTCK